MEFLHNDISILLEDITLKVRLWMWILYDSTPPYFHEEIWNFFKRVWGKRSIGRGGPTVRQFYDLEMRKILARNVPKFGWRTKTASVWYFTSLFIQFGCFLYRKLVLPIQSRNKGYNGKQKFHIKTKKEFKCHNDRSKLCLLLFGLWASFTLNL